MSEKRRLIGSYTFPADSSITDDQIKSRWDLTDNGTTYSVERSIKGGYNPRVTALIYEEPYSPTVDENPQKTEDRGVSGTPFNGSHKDHAQKPSPLENSTDQ